MVDERESNEKNSERLALADQMLHVLPRFAALVDALKEYDTPHGRMGIRQLSVLYALRYQVIPINNVSPSLIADFFSVKPSVITRVLAKLEENGMIVRRPNESDGRSFHVDITEKGREVSVYVEHLYLDWMMDGIEFLDDKELPRFRENLEILSRLADKLDATRRDRRR
ncbi:MAG: MarR family winged helix-turn-helix transcriptional regulator [Thermomicrobiales bacterium]